MRTCGSSIFGRANAHLRILHFWAGERAPADPPFPGRPTCTCGLSIFGRANAHLQILHFRAGECALADPHYSHYMDQEIIKATEQGKHIILETTGSFGPPTWILDFVERVSNFPYIFTVVFPVVLPETIEERAVDRFLKRAHRVLENDVEGMYMKEPPRLPSIVELREKNIPQSHDNFVKTLADNRFQHVLLYNNNESCAQNCYMLDLNNLSHLRSKHRIGVTKQILAQGGLGDRVTLEIVKKIMQ